MKKPICVNCIYINMNCTFCSNKNINFSKKIADNIRRGDTFFMVCFKKRTKKEEKLREAIN